MNLEILVSSMRMECDDILRLIISRCSKISRYVCHRWRDIYDQIIHEHYPFNIHLLPANLLTPADFRVIINTIWWQYYHKLNMNFIWRYSNLLNMCLLAEYQKLSDEFLFAKAQSFNRPIWEKICSWQLLPEDFLRAFSNKLCWSIVSLIQSKQLSPEFVHDFSDRIDWNYYGAVRVRLTPDFKRELSAKTQFIF